MLSFCNVFPNAKAFGYNHAVNAEMPVMYIDGNELKREQQLKYLGITYGRSLCGNEHVTRTRLALSFKRMRVAKFQTKVRKIVMRYLITDQNDAMSKNIDKNSLWSKCVCQVEINKATWQCFDNFQIHLRIRKQQDPLRI